MTSEGRDNIDMNLKSRRVSTPQEVLAMIAHTFQDAFDPQWVKTHLPAPTHDLIILRHLLPFYHPVKGRNGNPLRIMIAVSMLARLIDLGYRSAKTLKLKRQPLPHLFMRRSADVEESHRETCRKARSCCGGHDCGGQTSSWIWTKS